MDITKWAKPEGSGVAVIMTTEETIRLIRSLAQQIEKDDQEYNRAEFWANNNEYFSIAVVDNEKSPPDICGDCGNWINACVCPMGIKS
jgi:hypothetical protein